VGFSPRPLATAKTAATSAIPQMLFDLKSIVHLISSCTLSCRHFFHQRLRQTITREQLRSLFVHRGQMLLARFA
jgi:hypothetical protein